MCSYKTLPRAFIIDQVPFPLQYSVFHPAARDIFSGVQQQPYLVHRATGGTCSAVLSKLALPSHLIPHTQFTGSPLGRQDIQCNCHMSCSSPWIFADHKPTSLLQSLTFSPHCPFIPSSCIVMCAHSGDTGHKLGAQKELRDPLQGDVLVVAPQGTQIWCLWTCWRFLQTLPHCSPGAFLTPSVLVWHCPISWSCFLSSFSPVPSFLIVAFHFPLAAGLETEVSQLATATHARHHHPLQAADTGAFRPRAGLPHCHEQSSWWPLALLPGHRSRNIA